MRKIAFQLPDELWGFTIEETVSLAQKADSADFYATWKGETSGTNGLMTLALIAEKTEDVRLGTGIVNVFSRSPSLLAMSIATLDEISDGRAILGLGASSKAIVEGWHGIEFERPLRRTHETIEIIKQTFEGETLKYDGELFDVGPYNREFDLVREDIPIYNAAAGPKNRGLTGNLADGWIPVFTPLSKMSEFIAEIREAAASAGRKADTLEMMPWVPTYIDDDPDVAKFRSKKLLAREMAMGYNNVVRQHGYGDPADRAFEKWRDGNRDAAAAEITDEMIDEFVVYGPPEQCRSQLQDYYDAGVDCPVIWPNFEATHSQVNSLVDNLGPDAW